MLHKLVFDTTSADTIADSHSVGAYLRSADGTLITHTDVDGKKALDVRVAEGINVEVDLAAADDSVAAWANDGAGNAITSTTIDTDTGLDVNIINDPAVANTDLVTGAAVLTAGDTEEDLIDSPLTGRKYLWIYNNGNRTMYIGKSGVGVDASTGFPIPPGAMLNMRAGDAIDIEWVSNLTSHDVRYMEIA